MAVAARKNGSVQPAVFRLGDLTPERREIEFERTDIDGRVEVVQVKAWAGGRNRLSSVVAQMGAAYDRWQDSIGGPNNAEAYLQYRRETLAAVIPSGMTGEEIDTLAADSDRFMALLVYLGWRDEQTEDTDDSPEAPEASPSTGAASSPTSSPATDPSIT